MSTKLIPAYIFECSGCGKLTAERSTPIDCKSIDSQFSKELREVLGETATPSFLQPCAVTCVHCGLINPVGD